MFGWSKSTEPRRMSDTSGAWDGAVIATRGVVYGTRIATNMGWRPVEALAPGDRVLTFDNGLCPVREVRRDTFWPAEAMEPGRFAPMLVPAGALGNRIAMHLLPDQGVMIESDAACDRNGDPFAVVPAHVLDGFRGIRRVPPHHRLDVITLVFDAEEVIYAEGGLLLHCPRAVVQIDELTEQTPNYDVVPARDAAFLVECMVAEDAIQRTQSHYAGSHAYGHAA